MLMLIPMLMLMKLCARSAKVISILVLILLLILMLNMILVRWIATGCRRDLGNQRKTASQLVSHRSDQPHTQRKTM